MITWGHTLHSFKYQVWPKSLETNWCVMSTLTEGRELLWSICCLPCLPRTCLHTVSHLTLTETQWGGSISITVVMIVSISEVKKLRPKITCAIKEGTLGSKAQVLPTKPYFSGRLVGKQVSLLYQRSRRPSVFSRPFIKSKCHFLLKLLYQ